MNFKKLLVIGFIGLNIMSMLRVHLPLSHPILSHIYRPVDAYLSFFSIFQSWRMFSPNPSRLNSSITAEIKFIDGSTDTYVLPKNSDLNLRDQYQFGERFRVIGEVLTKDVGNFLRRDVAKFSLRQVRERNFHKIPLKVDLIERWSMTPDLKKEFIPHSSKTELSQSRKFYTHEVL